MHNNQTRSIHKLDLVKMKVTSPTMATPRIVHSYEDFAEEAAILERQQLSRTHKGTPGPNEPFPIMLHWMLQQAEENGNQNIVGWAPHGRAFRVHQRAQFVTHVLPV
jgi:hypothetical protein